MFGIIWISKKSSKKLAKNEKNAKNPFKRSKFLFLPKKFKISYLRNRIFKSLK